MPSLVCFPLGFLTAFVDIILVLALWAVKGCIESAAQEHFLAVLAQAPVMSTGNQMMASIMSTVMSRLNSFLDSEMEQVLCFDPAIDAERFCHEKSAAFIVLSEENLNVYFMLSRLIQQLYLKNFSVAVENGGKLPNSAML